MMDDDRIYHVKLHERGTNWFANIFILAMLVFWGGLLLWLYLVSNKEPYVLDLYDEKKPVMVDYSTRYEIIVRVEKENGAEIRLYDPESGKLLGTVIEPSSAD